MPADVRPIEEVAIGNDGEGLQHLRKDDERPLHRRSLTGPDMGIRPDQDLPVLDRQPADSRMVSFYGVVRGAMILDRKGEPALLLDVPAPRMNGSGAYP